MQRYILLTSYRLLFNEGKTTSTDGDDGDLSINVLIEDFCAVIEAVYPDPKSAPSLLVCKLKFFVTLLFGEVSIGIWAAFLKEFWDVLGGSEPETVPGTNLAENRLRNDFRNDAEAPEMGKFSKSGLPHY
jgi:hypothetical protein